MSRVLYLDRHGTQVAARDGRLVLHLPDAGEQDCPAHQVDQVIVLGHAHFTHDAIALLLRDGIPVVFSSLRGGFRGTLAGRQGRQVALRAALYDAMRDEGCRLAVAHAIVAAKLRGHGRLLRQWRIGERAGVVAALAASRHCHGLDQLRGCEGGAARTFFAGLRVHLAGSGFDFAGRQAHPPPDPVNAVLSLLYTLMLNEVEVGAAAAGLDPAAGFYHAVADGRPALLMDLVEPLRPAADRLAASLLRNALDADDFAVEEGACHLRDGRRGIIYMAWEEFLCSGVAWRGEHTTWRRLIHLQPAELVGWLAGRREGLRFWHQARHARVTPLRVL